MDTAGLTPYVCCTIDLQTARQCRKQLPGLGVVDLALGTSEASVALSMEDKWKLHGINLLS